MCSRRPLNSRCSPRIVAIFLIDWSARARFLMAIWPNAAFTKAAERSLLRRLSPPRAQRSVVRRRNCSSSTLSRGCPTQRVRTRKFSLAGDFGDTSLEAVAKVMAPFSFVTLRQGLIPASLRGPRKPALFIRPYRRGPLLDLLSIAWSSFTPDLSRAEFWSLTTMASGSYELAEKRAVDEFFASRVEKPISLANGQTLVIKAPLVA